MQKKLYLDKKNGKLAGVCAGIAEYLDVDVVVVRCLFLIAMIWGTFGLWAYIICWALVPQKPADGGNSYVKYGD